MSLVPFSHRIPLPKTTRHRVVWTHFLGDVFPETSFLLTTSAEGGRGRKGRERVKPCGDPQVHPSLCVFSPLGRPVIQAHLRTPSQVGQCLGTQVSARSGAGGDRTGLETAGGFDALRFCTGPAGGAQTNSYRSSELFLSFIRVLLF